MVLDKNRIKTRIVVAKFTKPSKTILEEIPRARRLDDLVGVAREVIIKYGNVILDEGANFILSCLKNGSCLPAFSYENSYIGVGDGTDPEDPSQTGLTGTNKLYKQVLEGYPKYYTRKVVFRSAFYYDEANFAWNEATVANGPGDSYINLNRSRIDVGTKTDQDIWAIEITIEIT